MKDDNDGEARIAYYLSSSFACGWSFENVFKDYYFLVLQVTLLFLFVGFDFQKINAASQLKFQEMAFCEQRCIAFYGMVYVVKYSVGA